VPSGAPFKYFMIDTEQFKKELIVFINTNLKNKNGKFEGQRLSKKWMEPRFPEMFKKFQKMNLLNSENIYEFLNESSKCAVTNCLHKPRFQGFKLGYKEFCEPCGRTHNNHMKKQGSIILELEEIINYIKIKNKYNTSKIKQLSPKTIELITERTNYLDCTTISERLYHIEHNMFSYPKCAICSNENKNFKTSIIGYFTYCKKCAFNIPQNKINRKMGLRIKTYDNYKQKFNIPGYKITLSDKTHYLETLNLTIKIIHLKCGHSYEYSCRYQGHFKCPKCYPIRSRTQYEIFEKLQEYSLNLKFNDRQLIKPKEIDILCDEFKFGIEYDSLNYHSYGLHRKIELNNTNEEKFAHVNKTTAVENKGYQLFRIFSNEWHHKSHIWLSILKNKIKQTKKLKVKHCTIKSISSKECNIFLDKNHLHGYSEANVNIGLYFNKNIVAVMAFKKIQNNNYELTRVCSKLGLTIPHGYSKLLKFFEENYGPNSVTAYANRRWDNGEIYEKLKFKFITNTQPNYFYYKGDDFSKFIKQTETENMYQNGYRKIYDCGNKIYTKTYK